MSKAVALNFQPTKDDVLHDLQVFWQSPRSCIHRATNGDNCLQRSVSIDPQHPPDKKYRDEGQCEVANPLACRFWSAEVKHAAMVAVLAFVCRAVWGRLQGCGGRPPREVKTASWGPGRGIARFRNGKFLT